MRLRLLPLLVALTCAPAVVDAQERDQSYEHHLSQGRLFLEYGRIQDALAQFQEAAQLPDGARDFELHELLGSTWLQLDDVGQAVEWWRRARALAPGDDELERVDQRLEDLLRNFGEVAPRASGGRSFPTRPASLIATSPMIDPMKRRIFEAQVARWAEAGIDDGTTTWLPVGSYRVVGEELTVTGQGAVTDLWVPAWAWEMSEEEWLQREQQRAERAAREEAQRLAREEEQRQAALEAARRERESNLERQRDQREAEEREAQRRAEAEARRAEREAEAEARRAEREAATRGQRRPASGSAAVAGGVLGIGGGLALYTPREDGFPQPGVTPGAQLRLSITGRGRVSPYGVVSADIAGLKPTEALDLSWAPIVGGGGIRFRLASDDAVAQPALLVGYRVGGVGWAPVNCQGADGDGNLLSGICQIPAVLHGPEGGFELDILPGGPVGFRIGALAQLNVLHPQTPGADSIPDGAGNDYTVEASEEELVLFELGVVASALVRF